MTFLHEGSDGFGPLAAKGLSVGRTVGELVSGHPYGLPIGVRYRTRGRHNDRRDVTSGEFFVVRLAVALPLTDRPKDQPTGRRACVRINHCNSPSGCG